MEPLLTSFIAAGLAEWGDKTQLLVVALAARYGRPGPLLLGVALAALLNGLVAGIGGVVVNEYVTLRAISLLVGVALLFAGVAGFIARKPPEIEAAARGGPLLHAAAGFFIAEFGDKTQFITFSLAAQFDAWLLAAAGATAGIVAANLPAALLGPALLRAAPVRAIRYAVAALFVLTGFVVAVNALRLV